MESFSGEIRIREHFWFLDTSNNTFTTKTLKSRAGDYPYFESPSQMLLIDDYDVEGTFVVVEGSGRIADSSGKLRARFVVGRASFSSHCLVLTAKDPADVQFLYRVLSSERAGLGTGSVTGTATLTQAMLGAHRIPWPPKQFRNSFCALLDDLDAHRQLLGELQATLSCLMQAYSKKYVSVSEHPTSLTAAQETQLPGRQDLHEKTNSKQNSYRIDELCTLTQGHSLKHQDFSPMGLYSVYSSRGEIGKANLACTDAPTIILGFVGSRLTLYWCNSPVFVTSDAWYIDRVSSPLDMATLYFALLSSLDDFNRLSYRMKFKNEESSVSLARFTDAVITIPSGELLGRVSALATAFLKQSTLLKKARDHVEIMRHALVRMVICKPYWHSNNNPRKERIVSENTPTLSQTAHDVHHTSQNKEQFATCAEFVHSLLEHLSSHKLRHDRLLIENPHPHGFEIIRLLGSERSYCLVCSNDAQVDTTRSCFDSQEPISHKIDLSTFFGLEVDPIPNMRFSQGFCDIVEDYENVWSSKTVNVDDSRWIFGVPARNKSDYAWIQQTVGHLEPGGTAVVMVPNITLHINEGRNKEARITLARSGLLEAVISFPGRLKGWYPLPASCLIIRIPDRKINMDSAVASCVTPVDTRIDAEDNTQNAILFIDARDLSENIDDRERILPHSTMKDVVKSYERWTASGRPLQNDWLDERDYCRAIAPTVLEANGFDLRPWIYTSNKDGSKQLDKRMIQSSQPRDVYQSLMERNRCLNGAVRKKFHQFILAVETSKGSQQS